MGLDNIPINKTLKETLLDVKYISPEKNVFLNTKGEPIKEFKTAFNGALNKIGSKQVYIP